MPASPQPPSFIPPHGNYRELLSSLKAEVVYDFRYRFCQRFLKQGDRTIDQTFGKPLAKRRDLLSTDY